MTEKTRTEIIEAPTALVLGATGGIGGAVAQALHLRGYRVRALHRNAHIISQRVPEYEWVCGDAMNGQDVLAAAEGVDVIVHAVNPPGYRNWGKLVLPMIDNTIAAAKASGAIIIMPGTVYNFGPDSFPLIREDSPQNPISIKGRIRVELERRLEEASADGAQVIIVRAGDYFGPGAANNWFSQLIPAGRPVTGITYPGRAGVGHQWAYLPDVAETMARLLVVADRLPRFSRFHMDGYFDADGQQLISSIRRVVGKTDLKVKRFPWPIVWLSSPFVPLFRELLEMRYLWRDAIRLDNRKLVDFLGDEPHTPIDVAVRRTLEGLGCLEPRPFTETEAPRVAGEAA